MSAQATNVSADSRPVVVLAPEGAGAAHEGDVTAITNLINSWVAAGYTLHRREAEVRAHLGQFVVARDVEGAVVGCAAVSVVVPGLAEVRSVVVEPALKGAGISRVVMQGVIERATAWEVDELVLLTKQPDFFRRHGFEAVDPMRMPAAFVQRVVLEPGRTFVGKTAMRRLARAPMPVAPKG